VGLAVGWVILLVLSEEVFQFDAVETVVDAVAMGPLGLDAMLSGGAESLSRDVRGPGGRSFLGWTGLPTAERWAGATALWAAGAGAALFAALFRHREH
jgi:hypothetical protein